MTITGVGTWSLALVLQLIHCLLWRQPVLSWTRRTFTHVLLNFHFEWRNVGVMRRLGNRRFINVKLYQRERRWAWLVSLKMLNRFLRIQHDFDLIKLMVFNPVFVRGWQGRVVTHIHFTRLVRWIKQILLYIIFKIR